MSESVVFSASAYKEMVDRIVAYAREHGKVTVAEGRDLLDASRKYVLPLMEHLDQQRVTRRVGDERFPPVAQRRTKKRPEQLRSRGPPTFPLPGDPVARALGHILGPTCQSLGCLGQFVA